LTAFEFTGLGRGGQQIQRAKEVYTKAVETLVELASLQVIGYTITSFFYPNHSYKKK
jgi:vacuolar-type H+-ATPase subunit D/Vma8